MLVCPLVCYSFSIYCLLSCMMGFPFRSVLKNLPANAGDAGGAGLIPGSGRSLGEGNGNPLIVLPGKSHGQRSLLGYSPYSHKELGPNEWLSLTQLAATVSAYMAIITKSTDRGSSGDSVVKNWIQET